MNLPKGFRAAGSAAGIKASGRPDLALITADAPLEWAFTATTNLVKAPCVQRNRSRYGSGQPVRAMVINSGNANCATGEQGIWDNEDFAARTASALSLPRVQDVLTASTGVIGKRLPVDKIQGALPGLVAALGGEAKGLAQAILTTDLSTKLVAITLKSGARVVGVAKGSGMIHPNMATMLAFVLTDADVTQEDLRAIWPEIVAGSFNQVTVDGDTSPNDMAFVFSSRRTRVNPKEFDKALRLVCAKLARKIARDGEGASKLMTVEVSGARSLAEARAAARAVVRSPLVKAAAHGNDPNWGRVLSAIGMSGAVADLAELSLSVQGTTLYRGEPQDFDEQAVSQAMDVEALLIEVHLAAGEARATAWGCDLTDEYVRINADYHT